MNKNSFTLIFTTICFFLTLPHFSALAQSDDDVHFYIEEATVAMGEGVCLTISVTNFEDIVSTQASLQFNPFLLQFDSISAPAPELNLSENSFGFDFVEQGHLRFNFFDASNPYTLEDSSSMFSVCFTAIGEPGAFAHVNLGDFPIEVEIIKEIDNEFVEIGYSLENGGVSIEQPESFQYYTRSCATDTLENDGQLSFTFFADSSFFPLLLEYSHLTDTNSTGIVQVSQAESEATIGDLPPGDIVYTLSYSGGILSSDTATVYDFESVTTSFTVENPSCHDTSDGAIEIEVNNPDSIFYFGSWGNQTLFQERLEGLSNGVYYHFLTEQGGCERIDTVELFTSEITLTAEKENNSCPGDSLGLITASAAGGTPFAGNTYEYTWENGQMQTTINALRQNLVSGTYFLTVEDRNGCSIDREFDIINEFELVIESLSIEHVGCEGINLGSASFEVSYSHLADTPGFTYSLNDTSATVQVDSNTISIAELNGGTYTLIVTDTLNGMCSAEYNFTILEADTLLSVTAVAVVDETCQGDSDGFIEIAVSGGLPDGDGNYTFEWNTGSDQPAIDSLLPGDYSVTVSDIVGCEEVLEFSIGTTLPPSVDLTESNDPTCFGETNGSILVEVTEGTGGSPEIVWNTGEQSTLLTDLGPGSYQVIVTDSVGCSDQLEVSLTEPDSIVLTAEIVDESTSGSEDGSITLTVEGGTGSFSYDWSTGDSEASLSNLEGGEYCVTVMDANGCTASACYEVEITTSTRNLSEFIGVETYPNPTKSELIITLDNHQFELRAIEIIALDGSLVRSIRQDFTEEITLQLGDLSAGQYYVRLRFNEGTVVKPIGVIK
nr:T9SS type A sorting domain-containing protein [Saprospiraceae bacterium]